MYILCNRCAEKLRPPQGWELEDRRTEPPLFVERAASGIVTIPDEPDDAPVPAPSRRQLFFGYSG